MRRDWQSRFEYLVLLVCPEKRHQRKVKLAIALVGQKEGCIGKLKLSTKNCLETSFSLVGCLVKTVQIPVTRVFPSPGF